MPGTWGEASEAKPPRHVASPERSLFRQEALMQFRLRHIANFVPESRMIEKLALAVMMASAMIAFRLISSAALAAQ